MNILIAEDDLNIAKIAQLTLEKIGHHSVTLTTDGKACLEKALSEKYDLILLDGMMPHLDGLSVLKKLKEINYQTPIIFLSAKSQESDIREVLELGAIGYIQKPFDPSSLNQKIQEFIALRLK